MPLALEGFEIAPPHGDADDVEAIALDVLEVLVIDPVVLVGFEEGLLFGDAEAIVEGLDDALFVGQAGATAIEWRHPAFHDEPASEVDAAELDGLSGSVDDINCRFQGMSGGDGLDGLLLGGGGQSRGGGGDRGRAGV